MPTALAYLLTTVLAVTPTALVLPTVEVAASAPLQPVDSAPSAVPSIGGLTGPSTALPPARSAARASTRSVLAPESGVWPLAPAPDVVRGFDPPASTYGAGHRGVDLLGSPGQPVRAAASGRVTYAGLLAGRGVVVIDHGPTRTTYEPVDAEVAVGTLVEAGQRVGTLQASGSHCVPAVCLHWGLVEGSTYLDPLSLVGTGPVRLLPLAGLDRR